MLRIDPLLGALVVAAACGVHVVGPVPLGGRFWSAYFLDPFGTRLELATDRSGGKLGLDYVNVVRVFAEVSSPARRTAPS